MTSARQEQGRGLFRRLRRGDPTPRATSASDEEWRARLTPEQYRILRRRGTEAPFSAEHVTPDAEGRYRCAGCAAALFEQQTKFDSRSGWPSFTASIGDAVERRRDLSLGIPRTEVLCRACGGHLGHVFNDGPGPGGQRYCINGGALGDAR